MEVCLSVTVGILAVAVCVLAVRLALVRKGISEIRDEMGERLKSDTNVLIDVSTRDKMVCGLADDLNEQLLIMRRERNRFEIGDRELKEAITSISHDLRTPLTSICGYLELLKDEEVSPAAREYILSVEERTHTLKSLTEELFRYTIITEENDELDMDSVDVGRILESSLGAYYAVLKQKGIAPVINMPENKVERLLNENALSRIFGNILSNAVKYSDGDLAVTLSEDGTVSFSNHAAGLTDVQAARLFDRFYTVNTARKSTGLGLSIAKTLTEKMGGEISASCSGGVLTVQVRFRLKSS